VRARLLRTLRLDRLAPIVSGEPSVYGVREHAVDRALGPGPRLARPHALLVEPLGHGACAHSVVEHPPKHRPHVLRLDLINGHHPRPHLPDTRGRLAVWRLIRVGDHLAGTELVELTTARALDDLGALVFRDHTLHLHEQPILRPLADRPLDEVHLDAASVQL